MKWPADFSPEFCAALEQGLASRKPGKRAVAAFDADGTLWDRDFGEAFLRWLIAGRKLLNIDYEQDIFARYEEMVGEDRNKAYIHAVAMMAGLKAVDITTWSSWLASAWPNYRPAMNQLIAILQQAGVETWIVSASNGWSIKAAAPFAGIDPARTLGIMTAVVDGFITTEPVHPVTSGAGKVAATRDVIGARPLFAFGDSMGDFELLDDAIQPMVVGEFGKSNTEVIQVARKRGWPVTLF